MLLKFICKNIYSINDEIEFRMFKSPTRRLKNHVFHTKGRNPDILKSAIIYGPNAAGKTNFIKAMDFGKKFLLYGPLNNNLIDIPQFKLNDKKYHNTVLEYTFFKNDIYYIYGFEINKTEVKEEWCYEMKNKTAKLLFERKNSEEGEIFIDFNKKKYKNHKKFIEFSKNATGKTELFLTALYRNNSKLLTDVINWFRNLNFIYPDSNFFHFFLKMHANSDFFDSFKEILNDLDIDIENFYFKEGFIDDDWIDLPENLVLNVKKDISKDSSIITTNGKDQYYVFSLNDNNEITVVKLQTQHLSTDNRKVKFELNEESDGTIRLLNLIPMLLDFKQNDTVFIIDELDRSFHSLLSRAIYKFFYKFSKDKKSQFIASTHDTNLMDLDFFRNDEIWYVKKNHFKSTELYSLYEFEVRYDKKLINDYLDGRLGAIPDINIT